ncbi:hypothetical protein GW17_00003423 [Ensete ventricosum]|nr:hypothetical protein GW17_00003423 [Ensete ventricosum]
MILITGNKASATVQPFLLLHLDIFPEAVHTIEDALHLFSAPETLEGYKASAGKVCRTVVYSLSKGGTYLFDKRPVRTSPIRDCFCFIQGRRYELVATITHHGREPSKGHYTADARYSNGVWLRYDDATVTAVTTNKVLHDQAYVLFYKQM